MRASSIISTIRAAHSWLFAPKKRRRPLPKNNQPKLHSMNCSTGHYGYASSMSSGRGSSPKKVQTSSASNSPHYAGLFAAILSLIIILAFGCEDATETMIPWRPVVTPTGTNPPQGTGTGTRINSQTGTGTTVTQGTGTGKQSSSITCDLTYVECHKQYYDPKVADLTNKARLRCASVGCVQTRHGAEINDSIASWANESGKDRTDLYYHNLDPWPDRPIACNKQIDWDYVIDKYNKKLDSLHPIVGEDVIND